MRFVVRLGSLCFLLALSGCPRQSVDDDAGSDDAGPYDPATGNRFTGEISLDDTRVMGTAPSSLRAGASACRAPLLVRVSRAVDGDTIHVTGISEPTGDIDVRFIGVNAPEIIHSAGDVNECYGPEATVFTNQLTGHLVWLTFDAGCEDIYHRTLAYVHIGAGDGDLWQRQLLRRGFARTLTVAPNDMYAPLLATDEMTAMTEGAGLWSACM